MTEPAADQGRAGESLMDFDEFLQKMTAEGVELVPWQKQLAERMFRGEKLVLHPPPRYPNKHQAQVLACAIAEVMGERWEVVGVTPEQEQRVRSEAREMAARLADGGEVPGD